MLNAATLANKYKMLPDAITLTLTPFNVSVSAMSVEGCRQRPAERKDIEWTASLGLGLAQRVFLLPAANMTAGYEVVQNDVITDPAGARWNAQASALELQGTIWRVWAKKSP